MRYVSWKTEIAALISLAFSWVAFPPGAQAFECGQWIPYNTTLKLTADLDCRGKGFYAVIMDHFAVLDGNGHSLILDPGDGGITQNGTWYVTVRNLTIRGGSLGIGMNGIGHTYSNIRFVGTGNAMAGVAYGSKFDGISTEGGGEYGILILAGSNVSITNSQLTGKFIGLAFASGSGLSVTRTLFSGNAYGLVVWGGASRAAIHESEFSGNSAGVLATGADTTDATNNYWGSENGPPPTGSGDPVYGDIAYVPFLTKSPFAPKCSSGEAELAALSAELAAAGARLASLNARVATLPPGIRKNVLAGMGFAAGVSAPALAPAPDTTGFCEDVAAQLTALSADLAALNVEIAVLEGKLAKLPAGIAKR